jgi:hypothetical protein
MMPGGHLATSAALGATAYWNTGSLEIAAGCFAGGFLIDFDHYLDYLVFERQWRRPSPAQFLRYYFKSCPRLLVLPLHSFELMTLLTVVALAMHQEFLIGYLAGAAMHLAFDIVINGDFILHRPFLFYFFTYRAVNRFAAANLFDPVSLMPEAGSHPYREFFNWRPPGVKALTKESSQNSTGALICIMFSQATGNRDSEVDLESKKRCSAVGPAGVDHDNRWSG